MIQVLWATLLAAIDGIRQRRAAKKRRFVRFTAVGPNRVIAECADGSAWIADTEEVMLQDTLCWTRVLNVPHEEK